MSRTKPFYAFCNIFIQSPAPKRNWNSWWIKVVNQIQMQLRWTIRICDNWYVIIEPDNQDMWQLSWTIKICGNIQLLKKENDWLDHFPQATVQTARRYSFYHDHCNHHHHKLSSPPTWWSIILIINPRKESGTAPFVVKIFLLFRVIMINYMINIVNYMIAIDYDRNCTCHLASKVYITTITIFNIYISYYCGTYFRTNTIWMLVTLPFPWPGA